MKNNFWKNTVAVLLVIVVEIFLFIFMDYLIGKTYHLPFIWNFLFSGFLLALAIFTILLPALVYFWMVKK